MESKCFPYCNCDRCRVKRLEMRERHLIDELKSERRERDEAQEAAETYWEAWQDAAVYWKDKVARLEAELDRMRRLRWPNGE